MGWPDLVTLLPIRSATYVVQLGRTEPTELVPAVRARAKGNKDRVPWRGVAGVGRRDVRPGRFGQSARTGRLTAALSPSGAMVSSVM
jgi:hypothetical protein